MPSSDSRPVAPDATPQPIPVATAPASPPLPCKRPRLPPEARPAQLGPAHTGCGGGGRTQPAAQRFSREAACLLPPGPRRAALARLPAPRSPRARSPEEPPEEGMRGFHPLLRLGQELHRLPLLVARGGCIHRGRASAAPCETEGSLQKRRGRPAAALLLLLLRAPTLRLVPVPPSLQDRQRCLVVAMTQKRRGWDQPRPGFGARG